MRVRPRSSEKKAWLLSAPSTVLLFSKALIPRKLSRPKPLPLLTTVGVNSAKFDQRPPLMGRLLIDVSSIVLARSGVVVLIFGASAVTSTVSDLPPALRRGETHVR